MKTTSPDYLKFILAILDAHNQGWTTQDIAHQFLELKMKSEFVPETDIERVVSIVEDSLETALGLLKDPSLIANGWFELTDDELKGFYSAFTNRKPKLEAKCWAVTFRLTIGSRARAYCLAPSRDDAVEMVRKKVLCGKLERAVQVTSQSTGHNHEIIAEVCVSGGLQVEVIG